MYFQTREEEVVFLKKLWLKEQVVCPKCSGTILEHLHKKAKKAIAIGNVLLAARYTEQLAF